MKYINFFIVFIIMILTLNSNAQSRTPYSWQKKLNDKFEEVEMPNVNVKNLEQDASKTPFRFGVKHEVNFNLYNSGTWTKLENGDSLWRLSIHCPEAYSINLSFEKFWLSNRDELYIYNSSMSELSPKYTADKYNKMGTKQFPRYYSSSLFSGSTIIIELYHKNQTELSEINISGVIHG